MRRSRPMIFLALLVCCFIVASSNPVNAKDLLYVPVSNALQIIDCDTDTVVETVKAYSDYIVQALLSPDKKRYYLNAGDRVYVFDTTTNKLIDTYQFSQPLSRVTAFGLAVSEDNTKLYLNCTIVKRKNNIPRLNVLPPQLVVYDVATKKAVHSYDIPYNCTGVLTLRNDPDHLILVGLDVHKLDLRDGRVEKIMGLLNPENGEEAKNTLVIWHNGGPDDHGIFSVPYYTATGMGYLIVDRNTGEVRTLKAKDVWMEYSSLISPDKEYMYGVMDELIKIDMKTGETIKAIPVQRGTCYALGLTSDGKKIYVGPAGNDLSVYDTETLELLKVITLEADGLLSHCLSR